MISHAEGASHNRVAHPLLSEDAVTTLKLFLERSHFVGCNCSASGAPHCLNSLDLHHLVDFLSILSVVVVRNLNLFYVELTLLELGVFNVTQLSVDLK